MSAELVRLPPMWRGLEVLLLEAGKKLDISWEPRGKRRIHKKPRASEIRACRPWLEAEIEAIHPEVIVCLGATAAQSLLGTRFKLLAQRGQAVVSPFARAVVATIHPSSILRAPDAESRHAAFASLVDDLRAAAALVR